jgi:tRNA-binding protein
MTNSEVAAYEDFTRLDLRVGVIVEVSDFPRARKPAYRVSVDFGDAIGRKASSVQATNYERDALVGLQVICVVNFAPKNIAGFMSEVLVLGVPGTGGELSLLTPSRPARVGERVY